MDTSIGLTCTLKNGVGRIKISGKYAVYDALTPENARNLGLRMPEISEDTPIRDYVWARREYTYSECVQISSGASVIEKDLQRGMKLKIYTNRLFEDTGERVITIALINENKVQTPTPLAETNKVSAFQPLITILSTI